ncbi:MAG: AAA family ATPase [Alphaproteobacteria bacterium]|nr:AAA family ATPase [Alphaproteobacteria bacterium]
MADDWKLYTGRATPAEEPPKLPEPPPWRRFNDDASAGPPLRRVWQESELELINAALLLRRPLLVQGGPGSGKSMIAYDLAYELGLGEVLEWPINSRSEVRRALYEYDAVGRLHEATIRAQDKQGAPPVEDYIRLGPLGTALASPGRPRVLLIDEFDKCDVDLPNDLLFFLEKGRFEIAEIKRALRREGEAQVSTVRVRSADADGGLVEVVDGQVRCAHFPVVILTSNTTREFPPAFLRRCLRLTIDPPEDAKTMVNIVNSQLESAPVVDIANQLVKTFVDRRRSGATLANDQLLNAVYVAGLYAETPGAPQALQALALKHLMEDLSET